MNLNGEMPKTTLRVLVIEDSEVDFELLVRELRKSDYELAATRVETAEAMEEALTAQTWDIIFSDWSLPQFSALAALELAKRKAIYLPFIIVSGVIGEETAVEALRNGADDFLVKDKLFRLIPAIERALREAELRRERDEMREQLVISDRMASVGILAAGVAHEINNPLASIIANLELSTKELGELACRIPGIGKLLEQVQDAHEAAERLHLIVRDLRVFSRSEDERNPVDVKHVIDSSLRIAWNEIRQHARLIKEYEKVPAVIASESRLGQVFLNLIVNASQAITDDEIERNHIRIRVREEKKGRVLIEISDTGSGMSPDTLAKLFTPFFTTKPVGIGTGLGLTICKRIISDLGGELSVESEVGKGSIFRVTLPATGREAKRVVSNNVLVATAKRPGRILVVDDDAMIAAIIRRIFSPEHEVIIVNNPSEALNRIQDGERYDVILSDFLMPHMNGIEFYSELVRVEPDLAERVVFLTGDISAPNVKNFLDLVSNPRIEKPFDVQQLHAMVNDFIR